MNDEMLGTIALAKMLGATFKAKKRQKYKPDRVDITVELIDGDRTIWRLVVAEDVLARADITHPEKPSAEMFVPKARDLWSRAVAGDEAVYSMGELVEAA